MTHEELVKFVDNNFGYSWDVLENPDGTFSISTNINLEFKNEDNIKDLITESPLFRDRVKESEEDARNTREENKKLRKYQIHYEMNFLQKHGKSLKDLEYEFPLSQW